MTVAIQLDRCEMYSETTKVGVEFKRKTGALPSFNTHIPCEKGRAAERQKCFGTSDVFFCGCTECPRRKACEKLVSPWHFD